MSIAVRYRGNGIPSVPCADISFTWTSTLSIHIYFSKVMGGFESDLNITFDSPLALQWEQESFGLIGLPAITPNCEHPNFRNWTYPVIIVQNSPWADQYAANIMTDEEFQTHNVQHFVFVSMNDLLHVLSIENPSICLLEKH